MLRILLAEDDKSMRVYLVRALERVGYEVAAVDRGTEAIPLLETEPFDLLLTDIVMPEMDGIELAQKAAEIAPGIRVMFITGFAAVALQGRPQGSGRQGPLQALPPASDLVAEVERMFHDRGPARPALSARKAAVADRACAPPNRLATSRARVGV